MSRSLHPPEPEDERKEEGSSWPSLLLHAAFLAHVIVCPYTKVEESWTLHAVHDILDFGVRPSSLHEYDHFEHPGPVPRSFLGPLALSALSWPFYFAAERRVWGRLNPLFTQIIIRLVLAFFNAQAVLFFARRAKRIFGRRIADQLLLLSAVQFHLAFWAGRTVPNMLAFPLALMAVALVLLPDAPSSGGQADDRLRGLGLLSATAAVFRAELTALIIPLAFMLLKQGLSWRRLAIAGATYTLPLLTLAVAIDSHLWQRRLLWAELQGLVFNVLHGKSSQWGTSPFYAYFLSLLPRLLQLWLPFSLYACWVDTPSLVILAPAVAFVTLLSLLGHKEWRFVIYVVPLFNLTALQGVKQVRLRRFASPRRLPCPSLFWLLLVPTIAFTALATWLSQQNYPGGHALAELHRLRGGVHAGHAVVQIDAYAAMTGASLFTHVREHLGWTYDRSEDLSRYRDLGAFDYLVTSTPQLFDPARFAKIFATKGFAGLKRWKGIAPWPRFEDKVWVLERAKGGV